MLRIRRSASCSIALSPRARQTLLAAAITLLLAAGAQGCASSSSSPVVLRIGKVAIEKATVDHWSRAIALGSTVPGTLQSSETPRQKALDFLISANWAIGAAAERGLSVSEGEVQRGLRQRIEAVPNGRSEFQEELAATGQTLADVGLEVKAALALSKLRESLAKSVPAVTQAQIANYYSHHLQSFRIPDRRWVDLIEAIHGYSRALALGKQLGPGRRFVSRPLQN